MGADSHEWPFATFFYENRISDPIQLFCFAVLGSAQGVRFFCPQGGGRLSTMGCFSGGGAGGCATGIVPKTPKVGIFVHS